MTNRNQSSRLIKKGGHNAITALALGVLTLVFLPTIGLSFCEYLVKPAHASNGSNVDCTPLNPLDHPCDQTVSTVTELKNVINSSDGNETICLEDGYYSTGNFFLWVAGLTIRSKSGNREGVIIDNEYRTNQSIFSIRASNITLADLTLKRSWWHPVHVSGGGHYAILHNLHIIDAREQFIKVNNNGEQRNDNGTLSCSLLELTDTGRTFIEENPTSSSLQCYTGGIDVLTADNWHVHDNTFEDIYCTNGHLPTHMVLFWRDSSNPLVERNTVINCARGIGFGLGSSSNHTGGTIRNNMIYDNSSISGTFDVGIGVENGADVEIYNNTVFTGHYFNSIEYRFSGTTGTKIYNNLTNKNIASRNYGSGDVQANVTSAQGGWFYDLENGDLHLASEISTVVDRGLDIASVTDDIDGEVRQSGSYDIGADEYNVLPDIDLQDVILILQISAGLTVDLSELNSTDINNDQQLGLEEALYGLRMLAE